MQSAIVPVDLADHTHSDPDAESHRAPGIEAVPVHARTSPRGSTLVHGELPSIPSKQESRRPGLIEAPTREFPADFSWSHSKDGMLRACARRFGLHYVLSKGGARADAPAGVKEAFRLKQLKSLPAEIGSAVHRRAADCANAVIDGHPLPTLDVLIERTRAELNALAKSSRNLTAFDKQPARVKMLREVYYDVEGILRPELVTRAQAGMLTALETLHRAPLWEELREIPNPRVNVVLPKPFDRFDYLGRHVYAAPDLVFRRPGQGGKSPWTIVDWKVSRTPNYGDVSQIALYGVSMVTAYGWPLAEGCEGRVINLVLDQVDQFSLTADDLGDAGRRILGGTDRLWSVLMDDAGAPRALSRDDFAMTERTSMCEQCVFKAACHPAIGAGLLARAAEAA